MNNWLYRTVGGGLSSLFGQQEMIFFDPSREGILTGISGLYLVQEDPEKRLFLIIINNLTADFRRQFLFA